jgi:hypothetical protein
MFSCELQSSFDHRSITVVTCCNRSDYPLSGQLGKEIYKKYLQVQLVLKNKLYTRDVVHSQPEPCQSHVQLIKRVHVVGSFSCARQP